MTQELVRQGKGVVNTDLAAFHAAKKRRQRENHINTLEQRINRLEETVQRLEVTILACKREEMK